MSLSTIGKAIPALVASYNAVTVPQKQSAIDAQAIIEQLCKSIAVVHEFLATGYWTKFSKEDRSKMYSMAKDMNSSGIADVPLVSAFVDEVFHQMEMHDPEFRKTISQSIQSSIREVQLGQATPVKNIRKWVQKLSRV
jgi:polyhydroxyalkanoate synthesis regulator phasin